MGRPTPRRLPASVYWRRRAMVLMLPLLVIVLVARVLGGETATKDDSAQQVAAVPSADPTESPTTEQESKPDQRQKKRKRKKSQGSGSPEPTPTPTPVPQDDCFDADIVAQPRVVNAVAGSPVRLEIVLSTGSVPACYFEANSETLAVKITDADGDLWSLQQCPGALTDQRLTLYADRPRTVAVVWNGKRSDSECSAITQWVLPGRFDLHAAALGGEPASVTFSLRAPKPEVIEVPTKPKKDKKKRRE